MKSIQVIESVSDCEFGDLCNVCDTEIPDAGTLWLVTDADPEQAFVFISVCCSAACIDSAITAKAAGHERFKVEHQIAGKS